MFDKMNRLQITVAGGEVSLGLLARLAAVLPLARRVGGPQRQVVS